MDGALLIDKPAGITSAGVLRRLERSCGEKGFGHAGTLDPMATGLLVVLCGVATKLQAIFLDSTKVYEGTIRVGLGTDTDDVEGRSISEDVAFAFQERRSLTEWRDEILRTFSSDYLQRPPDYSAVKVSGKKGYELARAGREVTLAPRPVQIEFLQLDFPEATRIQYRIRCSKGTYVRGLARDIGTLLGSCACLETIRRLSSGGFTITQATTIEQISQNGAEPYLQSMRELVTGLPRLELQSEECRRLHQGLQAPLASIPTENLGGVPLLALFSDTGVFQGLIERVTADQPTGRDWRIRFLLPQEQVR